MDDRTGLMDVVRDVITDYGDQCDDLAGCDCSMARLTRMLRQTASGTRTCAVCGATTRPQAMLGGTPWVRGWSVIGGLGDVCDRPECRQQASDW